MDVYGFWDAVLRQDADAVRSYFHPGAWVNWHNTNEHFTVEEFVQANCAYPGQWEGAVEKVLTTPGHIITATHVRSKDGSVSCHAVSFFHVADGKILSVEEYWGDDGPPPQWRQELRLGTEIP